MDSIPSSEDTKACNVARSINKEHFLLESRVQDSRTTSGILHCLA